MAMSAPPNPEMKIVGHSKGGIGLLRKSLSSNAIMTGVKLDINALVHYRDSVIGLQRIVYLSARNQNMQIHQTCVKLTDVVRICKLGAGNVTACSRCGNKCK